ATGLGWARRGVVVVCGRGPAAWSGVRGGGGGPSPPLSAVEPAASVVRLLLPESARPKVVVPEALSATAPVAVMVPAIERLLPAVSVTLAAASVPLTVSVPVLPASARVKSPEVTAKPPIAAMSLLTLVRVTLPVTPPVLCSVLAVIAPPVWLRPPLLVDRSSVPTVTAPPRDN